MDGPGKENLNKIMLIVGKIVSFRVVTGACYNFLDERWYYFGYWDAVTKFRELGIVFLEDYKKDNRSAIMK